MRKEVVLAILICLLIGLNYGFVNNSIIEFLDDSETGMVERIVDGDTVIIKGNSTRLLGINTPERGEKYYSEAKSFLNELILNKTVRLEFGKDKTDKYGRRLAYIIFEGRNINVEIVKNGFANTYIYDRDVYSSKLEEAWQECLANGKNLCEKSSDKCANCIELKKIDLNKQEIVLKNNCESCKLTNWSIKDEGRKKFVFGKFILEDEISISSKDFGEDYVWTETGDTLFLRDAEGKLVLWEKI